MLSRSVVPAFKGALSLHQALDLCNIYLEGAFRSNDRDVVLLLCNNAEAALSHAKGANKNLSDLLKKDPRYQTWRGGVVAAYIDLGKLLECLGYSDRAELIKKKSEKWGGSVHDLGRLAQSSIPAFVQSSRGALNSNQGTGSVDLPSPSQQQQKKELVIATVSTQIFPKNTQPPSIDVKLPEPDERLIDTPQLACCLSLLQAIRSPVNTLEPRAYKWLQVVEKDADEQERLHAMSSDIIRAFKRDELKDAKAIAEVVCLAPILSKDPFKGLLRDFHSAIEQSTLLDIHRVVGLAQLIQGADSGFLDADDLIKILVLLSTRLKDTHKQSLDNRRQLTMAISHVLDAMAETQVKDVNREKIHEPLMEYLDKLQTSTDPYLVYQAAYAYQALLCVPDDETLWQGALRRTGRVVRGISGLVTAVKSVDLVNFIEGLDNIQKGLAGASKVVEVVTSAYKNAMELAEGGQGFLEGLMEGLSFKRKSAWYSALRGADTLIRRGELATFRKLVCEAPCRYDAAFQWGVCQRLGEVAASPAWDPVTRRSAVEFLGEIYQNDDMWGQHANVKQWILNILMQLATPSSGSSNSGGGTLQLHTIVAGALLQELEVCDDVSKLDLYRECRARGPIAYPLRVPLPDLGSPSLLDRVQNRPDVEGNLRMLRKQRTKERGIAVYIPPQAKDSVHDADDMRFPLMEKVHEFLGSDRKVFLLLGDSGGGKSTFSRELEFQLWQSYKAKTGRIPLHINLPTIEKPEHDMIAKQLRKAEFTEPQIREMKHYRKFILICDGYDESQQTHNLYMSNKLNQPDGWDAQMVISCRSEYLGTNYRDRFQPGDRNTQMDSDLFQEAVIGSFSIEQVQEYIQQYVLVQQPLWRVSDYKQALDHIPSLMDLVKNPFLMTLSLEVLPRMVDPGQLLSTANITRVGLYDHFVEQWLERNKKRFGDRDLSPQEKVAFERLSTEGFTLNGIEYLKKLAVAIYKEQDGHPVVKYSQLGDEGSWKETFFCQEHKHILLEACPLTRNGNQHRFIHRSILEYGLARAVFDPQDIKTTAVSAPRMGRRGSVDSILDEDTQPHDGANVMHEPDPNSPLVWRSFVNDYSLLQFLEERVKQEPVFKEQLLAFIEYSKMDKKWRKAAANAITILVRAGVPFIGADLQGIRIPGADISYGVFDFAQLEDADLRNTNLRGISLQLANLTGALMSGVKFGELPYLTEESEIGSCAYSLDGKLFVIGHDSGELCIYTTSTWEKIQTIQGHDKYIRRAVYSPTGSQIASASGDCTVRLWNAGTGACQKIFVQPDEVNCVAYSPRGDRIVTASDDKTVRVWDLGTDQCIQILYGHTEMVDNATFSPDGTQIASGSFDFTVRIWNAETGDCIHILSGHGNNVRGIAYSPRGDLIVSASYDDTVRLWDVRTGVCRHVLTGHTDYVEHVAYSPKGDQIASASGDGTVRLWDPETGANRHTFFGHGSLVTGVAYSPRGDQIASGSDDKVVRLWDVSAVAFRNVSAGHNIDVYDVDCSPDGRLIASSSRDGTIRLWDIETGSCRLTLTGHSNTVNQVAFSPEGNIIASAGLDNSIRLWDVQSGACLHVMDGHSDWVFSVNFFPLGNMIASSGDDGTVRFWDVETGNCEWTSDYHGEGVQCVALSPFGKLVASGSKDSVIRLWDADLPETQHTLSLDGNWVWDVAFSPDGKQLASAWNDSIVALWDVETKHCQFILIGHEECVYCLDYSPDGDLLASGSADWTVRLWDPATGECRAVLQDFEAAIRGVSWRSTLDGTFLVTGVEGGSVLMWKVTEAEGGKCRVNVQWSAAKGKLILTGTQVQGVRGLNQLNKQLLKQRGAVGEPEYALATASKKVLAMASVFSKLKKVPKDTAPPEILSAVEATAASTATESVVATVLESTVAATESAATGSAVTELTATESEATESGDAESASESTAT